MIDYSIVIPVYNAEGTLSSCVDSILSQTYNDFEVILVDDGSTDSSAQICDRYESMDSRVHVVHTSNRGASIARNVGIDMAQGKWISFVDADDIVYPDYIQTFDDNSDKSDLTFFGNDCLYFNDNKIGHRLKKSVYFGWNDMQDGILSLKSNRARYDFYGYTWNKFFRADIIKNNDVRFAPGLCFKEDEIFVDDYIVHCHSLAFIDNILYCYRIGNTGLTVSRKSANCLSLYLASAEKFIGRLTNSSLLKYQIQYLFDIWCQLTHMLNGADKEKNRQLVEFVRKFRPLCAEIDRRSNGIKKWMLWKCNSDWVMMRIIRLI